MDLWVPLPSLPHRTREALKWAPTKVGEARKEPRCPLGARCHAKTGDRDLCAWPWGTQPPQVASDPPLLPDPLHAQYLGCDPLSAAPLDYRPGRHW